MFTKSALRSALIKYTPIFVRRNVVRLGNFYERRDNPFPSQEGSLQLLKQLGWRPRYAIDVGAYHGDWAHMLLSVFPDCSVLMVEPQLSKEQRLRELSLADKRLELATKLLGATDGTEVQFIEMETGSSVFEEKSPYPRKEVSKTTCSLDTLLNENKYSAFRASEMLKIDTQGYELEVLKGASKTLSTADVVLMEVSLLPTNEGAPLFAEVIDFMTRVDFKLFDVCSLMRRKDRILWQADLMFMRTNAPIPIEYTLNAENWG